MRSRPDRNRRRSDWPEPPRSPRLRVTSATSRDCATGRRARSLPDMRSPGQGADARHLAVPTSGAGRLHVGMMFDAALRPAAGGAEVNSRVHVFSAPQALPRGQRKFGVAGSARPRDTGHHEPDASPGRGATLLGCAHKKRATLSGHPPGVRDRAAITRGLSPAWGCGRRASLSPRPSPQGSGRCLHRRRGSRRRFSRSAFRHWRGTARPC